MSLVAKCAVEAAESFRQDTEESWLAVSSHTTTKAKKDRQTPTIIPGHVQVDPEIASSDLYQVQPHPFLLASGDMLGKCCYPDCHQVAESLRRAAEDKLLQSERDGLRSQQRTPAFHVLTGRRMST